MTSRFLLILLLGMVLTIVPAVAAEHQGAEEMMLNGGARGKVPFSHRKHQYRLGDCNVCHSLFEQRTGAIQDLQDQGKLEKKQVMNKLCIKCHRAERKAQKPYGPTTCSKCHIGPEKAASETTY